MVAGSRVRELGAAAFEQAVSEAVPLSEQLLAHAASDCDLATAEGRSRMLGQARPLLEQLPDGLLREQLLAELSRRGGVDAATLAAHWQRTGRSRGTRADQETGEDGRAAGGNRAGGRTRGHASQAPRAMGGRRTQPQTATLLDRTAWLLARHASLWLELPADDHDFLGGQPAPHGTFFVALDRVCHEHGPMTLAALMDEIERDADADLLHPLIERMRGFHEFEDEQPKAEIDKVLHRLRETAVNDEIQWLMESGDLSDSAAADRLKTLFKLRADMKNARTAPAQ